jgi:hypothetical protein
MTRDKKTENIDHYDTILLCLFHNMIHLDKDHKMLPLG